jgi:MFS family permease
MVIQATPLASPPDGAPDGWKAVGASLIALMLGYSTFVGITFGLFLRPLSATFGWSRTEISVGFSIASGLMMFLAPIAGMAIDRFGARRIILPAAIALGLVVSSMSLLSDQLVHFYVMYALVAITGMGTLPAGYTHIVVQWFTAKRGLALGVAMSGVGVGAVVMPLLLNYMITHHGWRSAYLMFGALVCCISVPVIILWVREPAKTRQASHHVSNDTNKPSSQPSTPSTQRFFSYILHPEQRRLVVFLFSAFALLGLASGGLLAHLVALFVDQGLLPSQASLLMSLLGVSLIVGRIGFGKLLDRFFAPHLIFLTLLGFAAGIVALLLSTNHYAYAASVVVIGMGLGAEFDFMAYLASRYFSLAAFGAVSGLMYSAFQAGAMVGPLVMGYSYDTSKNYTAGLITLAIGVVIAAIVMLKLGPYREPCAQRAD